MDRETYNKSKCGITMEVKIVENGRKIDKIVVTDTVGLKRLMTKYSLK